MKHRPGTPARTHHLLRRTVPLLRGAAVPLGAAAVALGALALYAVSGAAGAPDAVIRASAARILLPPGPGADATAALVTLRNDGGSAGTLTGARTPWGTATLAHTVVSSHAGRMEALRGVTIAPGQVFTMAAETTDLMMPAPPHLTLGQQVRLSLEFAGSATVGADAVVVRPGD